jgi:hypothetical protein
MSPSEMEIQADMRRRAMDLFSQDTEVLLDLLNRFMFWKGDLVNDAQVALHNAAEHYVTFLMGPPLPTRLDQRYTEQLEALLGGVQPLAHRMSGASDLPHDKPRKGRKVKTDA